MREQLIQHVNLLFAGTKDCEDMRQEILQNTLDRYDDLVSQGKAPEAAFGLAISGIGNIQEILGSNSQTRGASFPSPEEENPKRKKLRALAIALYILCAIPVIIFSELGLEVLGLSITLVMVAIATYLIIVTSKKESDDSDDKDKEAPKPENKLKKTIHTLLDVIMLAVYFTVSFLTKAWAITWLIFPIFACIEGLIDAIMDLKEAKNHEN